MSAEKVTVANLMSVRATQTSPDGTTVPPAVRIVDAEGVSWSLSQEGDHGGRLILKNGRKFVGAGVRLVWSGGRLYVQNAPGAWFRVMGDFRCVPTTVLPPGYEAVT